ncbi:NAD(P)-binding protein [Sistotremastrum suecicum HHB10207 ss-3]|uniref:NAD(P)-binding protein n=1 Tax=Sistotremastrum suecicum HHB10207 ss-3 TaxID=1314776 RepID=A0A165XT01_9AGAM|nr:NAD(P)-binding protein [Sistotremastrum suecicum HHB10207 ss-3]
MSFAAVTSRTPGARPQTPKRATPSPRPPLAHAPHITIPRPHKSNTQLPTPPSPSSSHSHSLSSSSFSSTTTSSSETFTRPKVWFITGCSSGFGFELVHSALARGDRVIATARSLDNIRYLERSDRCYVMNVDVSNEDESVMERIAKEAWGVWDGVDVVVNNAGFGTVGSLEEAGVQGLLKQYQTNVFGAVRVTNAFLPYMRQRRYGTVLFIGSRSGWRTNLPLGGIYASSKAALHAIAETYRTELAQFNIRSLLIEPGGFRTRTIRTVQFSSSPHQKRLSPSMSVSTKHISDYDDISEKAEKFVSQVGGSEEGDPKKAAEVILDIVRGEGVARGREWPEWLFLGSDCLRDVGDKCDRVRGVMEEWKDVSLSTRLH